MDINFCTPSFFFNNSQKLPFLVYDFRDNLSGSLKNTIKCQYVSQIQLTAEIEEYFLYPETPSEIIHFQTMMSRGINIFWINHSPMRQLRIYYIWESIENYSCSQCDC